MSNSPWQKSTYSGDASNCVYVSADPTGTVRLRESDAPNTILTTTAEGLRHLVDTLKSPAADSPHH
ncbi:DUF397 domain-containing protein [Streptomyces sp. STR69]|uniref:DUF397 domain-containing protein n=1 Tax=Streptomyces sp. STR69 TaxID=1796942 RepID=UPI0021C7F403|nr:DUF397 domain-containing protein [Streptomyces sp. STR69]